MSQRTVRYKCPEPGCIRRFETMQAARRHRKRAHNTDQRGRQA